MVKEVGGEGLPFRVARGAPPESSSSERTSLISLPFLYVLHYLIGIMH